MRDYINGEESVGGPSVVDTTIAVKPHLHF